MEKTSSFMGIHRIHLHCMVVFFDCQVIFRGCTTCEKKSQQLRSSFQILLKFPGSWERKPFLLHIPHVTCLDVFNPHSWSFWMTWLVISKLATSFCPGKYPKSQIHTKTKLDKQHATRKCNPPEPLLSHSPTRLWSNKNLQKNDPNTVPNHPFSPLYTHPLDGTDPKKNDPKPPISMLNTWFRPTFKCCSMRGQLNPTRQWNKVMGVDLGVSIWKSNDTCNRPWNKYGQEVWCSIRCQIFGFLLDRSFGSLKLIGAETDWTVMWPNGDTFQNVWKIKNTRNAKKNQVSLWEQSWWLQCATWFFGMIVLCCVCTKNTNVTKTNQLECNKHKKLLYELQRFWIWSTNQHKQKNTENMKNKKKLWTEARIAGVVCFDFPCAKLFLG